MESEDLRQELTSILEPEPDDDGLPGAAYPHERLTKHHALDFSWWDPWEFSSNSIYSRVVVEERDPMRHILESLSAPHDLFRSALRLLGDSIVAYQGPEPRTGRPYQYYPAVLMTFWAGFEAFVRLTSEMLVQMVPSVPAAIRLLLLELEEQVERNGTVRERFRPRPVLDRYGMVLKYAFGLDVDRGSAFWQSGQAAEVARNAFVHYDVARVPSIAASQLWEHLEAMIMLTIVPSTKIRRTVLQGQLEIYQMLGELRPLLDEHEERTFFKGWGGGRDPVSFACAFENVDDQQYPRAGDRQPRPVFRSVETVEVPRF